MPLFWSPCLQAHLSNLFPKQQPEWSSHTGLGPRHSPAQTPSMAPHCLPDKSQAPWMVYIIRACSHLIRPISCHSLLLSLFTINIIFLVISWSNPSFQLCSLCWQWPVHPLIPASPGLLSLTLQDNGVGNGSSREPSRSVLGCTGCSYIIIDLTALHRKKYQKSIYLTTISIINAQEKHKRAETERQQDNSFK